MSLKPSCFSTLKRNRTSSCKKISITKCRHYISRKVIFYYSIETPRSLGWFWLLTGFWPCLGQRGQKKHTLSSGTSPHSSNKGIPPGTNMNNLSTRALCAVHTSILHTYKDLPTADLSGHGRLVGYFTNTFDSRVFSLWIRWILSWIEF